jgi:hypothetical protein
MDLKEKLKLYLKKKAQFRKAFKITSKTAWNPQVPKKNYKDLSKTEGRKFIDPGPSGKAWTPETTNVSGGSYGTERFPYKVDPSVR